MLEDAALRLSVAGVTVDVQDFGTHVSERNPGFFARCARFGPSQVLGEEAFPIAFLPVRAGEQLASE